MREETRSVAAVVHPLGRAVLVATAGSVPEDRVVESLRIVCACKTYAAGMHYHHVSLTELCKVADASERRVREAFYDCCGVAPTTALRQAALDAARQALLDRPARPDMVSRTANDFGFGHLGRFAAQYRTAFGEMPSETLALARMIAS